ncbi:RNA methyltransferase [Zobellia galactanivorans]|uniref:tRNA (guanosine(18)-2'-O)-methyltransferase n=1 Tax=Zobellia galactanivorans (strain DSM 12802 / CCUG 47099 / CIP 106680 / NCIMB 13871 / Dsij) TaxID=63186 RepID=G0LCY4_ZOBGA|nr:MULTISPECIES: RNA methyltransferase [Zobellia]MBU3027141.1 RNA methyltransferase [Zobellia galactanivorans]MDO6807928.1 RNA methyltransferase [Zobellia galactanivorans]OWW24830.1 rRNA methyltransferase [Zobellia sp. OII3]CAZ94116.1 tRNA guanosine-2'-O-methyltransferase [Zobellia galactanivorans]
MVKEELLEYLENFISEERKQRFLEILEDRTKLLTVAIEDVYQLHNTSAVIRSCEVFGIQEAHVIESRYGKRLDDKIAMGAQQWVDVHRYKSTNECIQRLKSDGYKVIATTPHNDSRFLEDFEIEGKTAFLFGTERTGLSQEAMEQSDGFLKIPMLGFTESLNISVSAAIILQHLAVKLRATDLQWQLSDAEKLEKRLDWTKKSIKSIDDILKRYEVEG